MAPGLEVGGLLAEGQGVERLHGPGAVGESHGHRTLRPASLPARGHRPVSTGP